jgi:hypothetical protein
MRTHLMKSLLTLGAVAALGGMPAAAQASHGADDPAGHQRHGADDRPGHDRNDDKGGRHHRRARAMARAARHGADDRPGHVRHGGGKDDGPNHR